MHRLEIDDGLVTHVVDRVERRLRALVTADTRRTVGQDAVEIVVLPGGDVVREPRRVLDNRRQRRRALGYKDSTLAFIECSLLNINHRIWLLENMLWWCFLPVIVAGMLIFAQIIMVVGLQDPATLFWELGKGVAIACAILGVVYWGNLWTARKYWQPRKEELEAIADSLKTS